MEKHAKKHSLRRRWLKTSILVTCVIVAVFIAVFSLCAYGYYHSGAQKALVTKADSTTSFFNDYLFTTYGEYYQSACQYAESFHSDDILELQFINARAGIERASEGAAPIPTDTEDVAQALESQKTSSWSGREKTSGARIMSVTAPLFADGGQLVGAMRFVQSLERVDRQFGSAAVIALVVGLLIVLTVIVSSSYFLRTVSEPLVELTALAHRIADGSYGIQAEKKYDDEIGDLIDAINEMSRKIGETEKTQTEFISSVSHELRTPLTAIKGWAEMLEDSHGDVDAATVEKGMGVIISETDRLSVMVEELLDFSRLQSGRMVLQPVKLDIIAELSEAVLTFEQRAIRESKELIFEESDDIIPVMGDKNRLRQVFINIIDNAIKYSDAGDRITVSVFRIDDGFVDIAVHDTGIGIPAEQLDKVKTKFFKGNATRRGSGIGLAVADEIVRMHGGELLLDSVEGEGTTVTIRLPIDAQK